MRAWSLCAMLAFAACSQGNGLGAGDLSVPPDLQEPDLLPPPDMVPPPTCGKIVFCAFQCGFTNLSCVLGCGQNAPPAQVTAALSLVGCAAQNCLASDMGTGGMLQILLCLQDKCPMQLDACPGLGISSRSE